MDKSGKTAVAAEVAECGGGNNEVVRLSFKPLPDEDPSWQNRDKMVKQNGTENEHDEAKEKMLIDEPKTMVTPMKNASEVKFGASNGDTKIDITLGNGKQSLSGMGKEELMKYANDPFWIRLRWILFFAFWLTWVAMLAGAIYIIVSAPKCSKPEPKKWYESSPIVELDVADLPEQKLDPKGFESLLAEIDGQNIKAISLPMILGSYSGSGKEMGFMDIDPAFGNLNQVEDVIKAAGARGQRIILEIDPTGASIQSEWFRKSVAKEGKYTDYFIWANSSDGAPPNNWKMMNNEKEGAWTWNKERQQYYLNYVDKSRADINFNNPNVVQEFKHIFKFWIDKKVSGFRLSNARYLVKDMTFPDMNRMKTQVKDRQENAPVLREWRAFVKNHTDNEGLFALKDNIGTDVLDDHNDKSKGIANDLSQNYQFLQNISAVALNASLNKLISHNELVWPGLRLTNNVKLDNESPQVRESIILMTMLLPGTPILSWKEIKNIIGSNNSTTFQKCAKARENDAFLMGKTAIFVTDDNMVLGYTRVRAGNPVYLVAYNSGEKDVTVDFTKVPACSSIPEEVKIEFFSSNTLLPSDVISKESLPSKAVPLSPKSTLVMAYAPESK